MKSRLFSLRLIFTWILLGGLFPQNLILTKLVDGLNKPVFLTYHGEILFVIEQHGLVRGIVENKLLYPEGCAIKYIIRHQDKGKKQDLLKAIHFIEMIIERDYK